MQSFAVCGILFEVSFDNSYIIARDICQNSIIRTIDVLSESVIDDFIVYSAKREINSQDNTEEKLVIFVHLENKDVIKFEFGVTLLESDGSPTKELTPLSEFEIWKEGEKFSYIFGDSEDYLIYLQPIDVQGSLVAVDHRSGESLFLVDLCRGRNVKVSSHLRMSIRDCRSWSQVHTAMMKRIFNKTVFGAGVEEMVLIGDLSGQTVAFTRPITDITNMGMLTIFPRLLTQMESPIVGIACSDFFLSDNNYSSCHVSLLWILEEKHGTLHGIGCLQRGSTGGLVVPCDIEGSLGSGARLISVLADLVIYELRGKLLAAQVVPQAPNDSWDSGDPWNISLELRTGIMLMDNSSPRVVHALGPKTLQGTPRGESLVLSLEDDTCIEVSLELKEGVNALSHLRGVLGGTELECVGGVSPSSPLSAALAKEASARHLLQSVNEEMRRTSALLSLTSSGSSWLTSLLTWQCEVELDAFGQTILHLHCRCNDEMPVKALGGSPLLVSLIPSRLSPGIAGTTHSVSVIMQFRRTGGHLKDDSYHFELGIPIRTGSWTHCWVEVSSIVDMSRLYLQPSTLSVSWDLGGTMEIPLFRVRLSGDQGRGASGRGSDESRDLQRDILASQRSSIRRFLQSQTPQASSLILGDGDDNDSLDFILPQLTQLDERKDVWSREYAEALRVIEHKLELFADSLGCNLQHNNLQSVVSSCKPQFQLAPQSGDTHNENADNVVKLEKRIVKQPLVSSTPASTHLEPDTVDRVHVKCNNPFVLARVHSICIESIKAALDRFASSRPDISSSVPNDNETLSSNDNVYLLPMRLKEVLTESISIIKEIQQHGTDSVGIAQSTDSVLETNQSDQQQAILAQDLTYLGNIISKISKIYIKLRED